MDGVVEYYQMTDFGLQKREGKRVEALTSDGFAVDAVLEKQWNGWNFTHAECGFRIIISHLRTERGAVNQFKKMVAGKTKSDFDKAVTKAQSHPDFEQPPAPVPKETQ